jgi:hypothetical protein
MKTLFALALAAVTAGAATLEIKVEDFTSNPLSARRLTLTPITNTIAGDWFVSGESKATNTPASGIVYWSNIIANTYRLDIASTPATSVKLAVPSTSANVNAASIVTVATITNGLGYAYAATVSDLRYPSLWGSNIIVWTNNGRVYIASAASGAGEVTTAHLNTASNAVLNVTTNATNTLDTRLTGDLNTASNAVRNVTTNATNTLNTELTANLNSASNTLAGFSAAISNAFPAADVVLSNAVAGWTLAISNAFPAADITTSNGALAVVTNNLITTSNAILAKAQAGSATLTNLAATGAITNKNDVRTNNLFVVSWPNGEPGADEIHLTNAASAGSDQRFVITAPGGVSQVTLLTGTLSALTNFSGDSKVTNSLTIPDPGATNHAASVNWTTNAVRTNNTANNAVLFTRERIKVPCQVATTEAIDLDYSDETFPPNVDATVCEAGTRILVKDQAGGTSNGIWQVVIVGGKYEYGPVTDTNHVGDLVYVEGGDSGVNSGRYWRLDGTNITKYGTVSTVNGNDGVVSLTANDVGAADTEHGHATNLSLSGGTMTGTLNTPTVISGLMLVTNRSENMIQPLIPTSAGTNFTLDFGTNVYYLAATNHVWFSASNNLPVLTTNRWTTIHIYATNATYQLTIPSSWKTNNTVTGLITNGVVLSFEAIVFPSSTGASIENIYCTRTDWR